MGIEVGALIALVTVLTVYLLPLLVTRRDLLGHTRASDRYSSRLRILATGQHARPDGETCTRGGHAQIFRQRPEVRAMNRPAVRNVRALRTERELLRARRAHTEARAQRAAAASHRLVVACALLGVLLGVTGVAALSPFPWWPVAVPVALLGVSMTAGHRAAVASQAADAREARRIAELEEELERLTGHHHGPAAPVASAPAVPAAPAASTTADDEAASRTTRPAMPAEVITEATQARTSHDAAADAGQDAATRTHGPATVPAQAPASSLTAPAEPAAQETTGAPAASASSTSTTSAAAVQEAAAAAPALARQAPTPPQGWRPVHVPAPTYTLVGTARPRLLDGLPEEHSPSAPVPQRPVSARPVAVPATPTPAAPIDLDEVLERRRAAGE